MKMFIVALALVAVAAAASVPEPSPQILRSEFSQDPEGSYKLSFESEDGITRNEQGELKQVANEEGKPQDVIVVRGSYTYTNPNGEEESISYTADEFGFHPEGKSIPKPVEARR